MVHRIFEKSLFIGIWAVQAMTWFADAEKCTPFTVVLAAFNTLLFRYSRQEDILVGVPVAGRTHADLESLVGNFVNTLVVRAPMSGDTPFHEHLQAVRQKLMATLGHQDLPFENLASDRQPAGPLLRAQVFTLLLLLPSPLPFSFSPPFKTVS